MGRVFLFKESLVNIEFYVENMRVFGDRSGRGIVNIDGCDPDDILAQFDIDTIVSFFGEKNLLECMNRQTIKDYYEEELSDIAD